MKKFEPRKIYQILDKDLKYRSLIPYQGEMLDYTSDHRREAIVYTFNEAKKAAKYYIEEKNVPVMIECRTVAKRKYI